MWEEVWSREAGEPKGGGGQQWMGMAMLGTRWTWMTRVQFVFSGRYDGQAAEKGEGRHD